MFHCCRSELEVKVEVLDKEVRAAAERMELAREEKNRQREDMEAVQEDLGNNLKRTKFQGHY